MAAPLNKSTIGTQVVQELRRRILSGQYSVGEKLQQELIADELGVSRSPVREALGQLEAEGLVVLTPQKGAQVAPLLASEIAELFELRAMLEPHLLTLAIPHLTEADLEAAEAVIAEMADITLDGWSDANWRFHEWLYAPADRPAQLKIIRRTHETIGRYIRMQVLATNGRTQANQEHAKLLDACRLSDTTKAVKLLRRHIEDAADFLEP